MPRLTARRLTDVVVARLPKAPEGARVDHRDSQAPGLFLRVNAAGAKTWMVDCRLNGRQTKTRLGTWPGMTLAEARTEAGKIRDDAKAGRDPRQVRAQAEAQARETAETFGDVAEAFLDAWRPRGVNTKREFKSTVDRHLAPLLGVRKRELHRRHLSDVIRGLESERRKGGPLPGAARKAYEAARQIVLWAVAHGLLEADPFSTMIAPKKGAPRQRALSDREIQLLWPVWDEVGAPFGPLYKFLLLTAARRNEAAHMTWSELDDPDEPREWIIPADRTKNGRAHLVPLSEPARAVLRGLPRGRSGPFTFSTTDGAKPISGFTTARRRTDRLAAAAAARSGVEPPAPWKIHDLRRTARTGMSGLDIVRDIGERCLNHHVGSKLDRIYDVHEYKPHKADAFQRWGEHVEALVSPRPSLKRVRNSSK